MTVSSLNTKPRIDATCSNVKCNAGIYSVAYTMDVQKHDVVDTGKVTVTKSRYYVFCPRCFDNFTDEMHIVFP